MALTCVIVEAMNGNRIARIYSLSNRSASCLAAEFGEDSSPEKWASAGYVGLLRIPGLGIKSAKEVVNLLVAKKLMDDPHIMERKRKRNIDADACRKIRKSRKVLAEHVAHLGGKVEWHRPVSDVLKFRRKRQRQAVAAWKKRRPCIEAEKQRRQAIKKLAKSNKIDSRIEARWIEEGTEVIEVAKQIMDVMEEHARPKPAMSDEELANFRERMKRSWT